MDRHNYVIVDACGGRNMQMLEVRCEPPRRRKCDVRLEIDAGMDHDDAIMLLREIVRTLDEEWSSVTVPGTKGLLCGRNPLESRLQD